MEVREQHSGIGSPFDLYVSPGDLSQVMRQVSTRGASLAWPQVVSFCFLRDFDTVHKRKIAYGFLKLCFFDYFFFKVLLAS